MFLRQVVSTSKTGPGVLALALTLGLAACGGEKPAPGGGNPVDPDVEAIPELGMNLTAFGGGCTTTSTTALALTFQAGVDETAILSKRVLDGAILVNGNPCTLLGVSGTVALSSAVKTIAVTGTTGVDTLILDFANGAFAPGTASVVGIVVDLGDTAGDTFKFRGQAATDTVTLGSAGMSLSTAFKDLTIAVGTNTPNFTFALSGGNDVFNTGGSVATGGSAWAYATTVYGGIGNDTFNEGAAKNGDTVFWGGAGSDTVSYAARTVPITVKVDGSTSCGDQAATAEADKINTDIENVTTGSGADILYATTLPLDPASATPLVNPTLTLNGGGGNDQFIEAATPTPNTVFIGGAGTADVVDYSARTVCPTLALTITMGAGINDGDTTTAEKDDVQATIEKVIGSSCDDIITGSGANDVIVGGPGNDTLSGAAGDDTFLMGSGGTDGDDTISGGNGVDTVDYSNRTGATLACDLTYTSTNTTALSGASGEQDKLGTDVENCIGSGTAATINTLTGNTANNELVVPSSNSAVNVLIGGGGDDTLQGGSGNDQFFCGAGDDITISGGGNDVFHDATGVPSTPLVGVVTKILSDCEL